jgi:hypothetical protein
MMTSNRSCICAACCHIPSSTPSAPIITALSSTLVVAFGGGVPLISQISAPGGSLLPVGASTVTWYPLAARTWSDLF